MKEEQSLSSISDSSALKLEINKLSDSMTKGISALRKDAAKRIKAIILLFFNEYPEIVKFDWEQYTPSFCDGDPCHFSINSGKLYLEGQDNESAAQIEEYLYGDNKDLSNNQNVRLLEAAGFIMHFINSFSESDAKTIFGESSIVTISKDGVDIVEDDSLDN